MNQDGPQDKIQEEDPGANGNLPEGEQIQKNQDGPQDKIQEEAPGANGNLPEGDQIQ